MDSFDIDQSSHLSVGDWPVLAFVLFVILLTVILCCVFYLFCIV